MPSSISVAHTKRPLQTLAAIRKEGVYPQLEHRNDGMCDLFSPITQLIRVTGSLQGLEYSLDAVADVVTEKVKFVRLMNLMPS